MRDADIEDLLRRYRPLGPPPELRARILSQVSPPRLWPWIAAAAATLVLMIGLERASAHLIAQATVSPESPFAVRVSQGLDDAGLLIMELERQASAEAR